MHAIFLYVMEKLLQIQAYHISLHKTRVILWHALIRNIYENTSNIQLRKAPSCHVSY